MNAFKTQLLIIFTAAALIIFFYFFYKLALNSLKEGSVDKAESSADHCKEKEKAVSMPPLRQNDAEQTQGD